MKNKKGEKKKSYVKQSYRFRGIKVFYSSGGCFECHEGRAFRGRTLIVAGMYFLVDVLRTVRTPDA